MVMVAPNVKRKMTDPNRLKTLVISDCIRCGAEQVAIWQLDGLGICSVCNLLTEILDPERGTR